MICTTKLLKRIRPKGRFFVVVKSLSLQIALYLLKSDAQGIVPSPFRKGEDYNGKTNS